MLGVCHILLLCGNIVALTTSTFSPKEQAEGIRARPVVPDEIDAAVDDGEAAAGDALEPEGHGQDEEEASRGDQ